MAGSNPASSLLGALTTRPVRETRSSTGGSGWRLRARPIGAGVSADGADVNWVGSDGVGLDGLLERGGLDGRLDSGGLDGRLDGQDEHVDALPPGRVSR